MGQRSPAKPQAPLLAMRSLALIEADPWIAAPMLRVRIARLGRPLRPTEVLPAGSHRIGLDLVQVCRLDLCEAALCWVEPHWAEAAPEAGSGIARLIAAPAAALADRKSTRLNSSHQIISYAVFCLKKKKATHTFRNHADIKSAAA